MLHLGGPGYPDDLLNKSLAPALFSPTVEPFGESRFTGLHLCEILDVEARLNCYVVRPVGLPSMPAVLLSNTPQQSVGIRDLACLPPRSLVLCWIDLNQPWAVILGSVSVPVGCELSGWSDSIVAASRVGLHVDEVHKHIATDGASHGYYDFSNGRPVDHLPGDWGYLNELGLGLFVGRLMAFMRAADDCKIEFHHADSLTRLVGRNFELMTGVGEEQHLTDEGECSILSGVASYDWEGMGALEYKGSPFKDEEGASPISAKMAIEPEVEHQRGFWRLWNARGYLGDLRHVFVSIPTELSGHHRLKSTSETTPKQIGLFEEWVGYDGRYVLRSAKSVLIEKTCLIRVPEQRQPLDSPDGDTEFEDGPGGEADHLEDPAIPEEFKDIPGWNFDLRAYAYSKLMGDGFNRHAKDWFVPKFSETRGPGDLSEESWAPSLPSGLVMDLPPTVEQQIDHRAKARYYKSRSAVEITDDGSVILSDGYGSSITLSRGNIEIACMGDINLRNGRNIVAMNGGDLILRAHGSADISAGTGDLRLKSENLLSVLGGNSGQGGVLIESRGTGSVEIEDKDTAEARTTAVGGIALKTTRGKIQMWSDELFLQAKSASLVTDDQIQLRAHSLNTYLTGNALQILGPRGRTWDSTNTSTLEHSINSLTVATQTLNFAASSLTLANSRTERDAGDINVALKGNLSVDGAIQNVSGSVIKATSESMRSRFSQMTTSVAEVVQDGLTAAQTFEGAYLTAETGQGNPEFYLKIGFSFRDSSDYRVLTSGQASFFETQWQHLLTAAGIGGATWEEPAVPTYVGTKADDKGKETLPYPGSDVWDNGSVDGQDAQFVEVTDRNYTWGSSGYKIKDGVTEVAPEMNGGPFKDRYLLGGGS